MKKYDIIKKQDDKVRKAGRAGNTVMNPSDGQKQFISFRYSYKSMTSSGGKTQVLAKNQRFENGQFESEEFEGTLDGNMYEDAMKETEHMFGEMQDMFFKRIPFCFKPSSFLAPFSGRDKERDE
jgi:hypothetical protein